MGKYKEGAYLQSMEEKIDSKEEQIEWRIKHTHTRTQIYIHIYTHTYILNIYKI